MEVGGSGDALGEVCTEGANEPGHGQKYIKSKERDVMVMANCNIMDNF
jgi:hypothetical protein